VFPLLILSTVVLAEGDADLSRAGALGILAYVVVTLAKVWMDSPRARWHQDDCHARLRSIQWKLDQLLAKQGEPSGQPESASPIVP
jgi:hypothetical protein